MKSKFCVGFIVVCFIIFRLVTFAQPVQAISQLYVSVDCPKIMFPGENIQFSIVTSQYTLISVYNVSAYLINMTSGAKLLYFRFIDDYVENDNCTKTVVAGVYKVVWTVPTTYGAGFYSLVVDASSTDARGVGQAGFQISKTLSQWNPWLSEVKNNTATIKTTLGEHSFNWTSLDAKVSSVDHNVVTLSTQIGKVQTTVDVLGNTTLKGIKDAVEANKTPITREEFQNMFQWQQYQLFGVAGLGIIAIVLASSVRRYKSKERYEETMPPSVPSVPGYPGVPTGFQATQTMPPTSQPPPRVIATQPVTGPEMGVCGACGSMVVIGSKTCPVCGIGLQTESMKEQTKPTEKTPPQQTLPPSTEEGGLVFGD